ncbi:MAG: hypothetical protein IJQ28_06925 [Clostridia bacterium]|nr:hypothetical protein [Clostridia bacterium]
MPLYFGNQKVCPVIKVESQPTGTLSITENGTYDVSTYASADVNVSGGGSSGYKFGVNVTGGYNITTMVVNNDLVNSLCDDWSVSYMNSKLKYLSVETVRFTGNWSGGYNYGTIYINGIGQSIRPNTTYTLASDNDYCDIVIASCLTADTSITLADGGTKPIKRLKVGDKILSLNPETLEQEEDEIIVADGQVDKKSQQYDVWTFEDSYVVKTCNRHRFYNVERQEFVYLDEWKLGEHTIVQEGKQVALLSHSIVNEEVQHCTIFTKKWNNYYANGLLSGNRDSEVLKSVE